MNHKLLSVILGNIGLAVSAAALGMTNFPPWIVPVVILLVVNVAAAMTDNRGA